jgi:hypothetical protein
LRRCCPRDRHQHAETENDREFGPGRTHAVRCTSQGGGRRTLAIELYPEACRRSISAGNVFTRSPFSFVRVSVFGGGAFLGEFRATVFLLGRRFLVVEVSLAQGVPSEPEDPSWCCLLESET